MKAISFPSGLDRVVTLSLRFGALLFVMLTPVSVLMFLGDIEKALLVGTVLGALMVLLWPALLLKTYDVFQPLSFVMLSVFVGVTGRTLYVLFRSSERVERLLRGHAPEFLLPAAFVVLLGLGCFVLGYLLPFPRLPLGKFTMARTDRWDTPRLALIVVLYTLLSLTAMVIFLRKTGFDFRDLAHISSKRYLHLGESGTVEYASLGYLRWVASLSQPAFLLVFTWFIRSRRRWMSLAGVLVLVEFLLAVFFPFVTSTRGSLLRVVLAMVVLWHYVRRPVSLKTALLTAILALVTLSVMLSLRRGTLHLWEAISPLGMADNLLGSRDFLDITTTAFIIEAVQDGRLTLSYGSTYLTWLFVPIPRTLWPEKPVISVGWVIKRQVLGLGGAGGTPPGFIGEAYWAFGLVGVVTISFFLGALIGVLYRSFRPYLSNANMALLYAVIVLPWSMKTVGGSWSSSTARMLQNLVPLAFALYVLTSRVPRSKGAQGDEVTLVSKK